MKMSELMMLGQLRPKIANKKMSIKTTYKFTRFFKEIEEQIEFFNNTIQNLIKEYGQKDENDNFVLTEDKNGVKIQEDKYDECMNKIDELNNLEINLNYIPSFSIDELENSELSMEELSLLMPFIIED